MPSEKIVFFKKDISDVPIKIIFGAIKFYR